MLSDGRIGLIDYGATKRLTEKERLTSCLVYAALYRNDEDMLYTMSQIGGYKSKYSRKDVLVKLMKFGFDSWGRDVTGGKNLQQFIDGLKETDPWEAAPDNLGKICVKQHLDNNSIYICYACCGKANMVLLQCMSPPQ